MHGLLFGLLGAAAGILIAALLRQPGVLLYDWVATRAAARRQAVLRKRQALIVEAAARDAAKVKRSRSPVTQAG